MTEVLLMSSKERERKSVLELVRLGHITLKDASNRLGLSYRQTKRIWRRYRDEHDRGLIHRSRGKASNNHKSPAFKQSVLAYYNERLSGFGPTFASEKLIEAGYVIDHETLRLWLIEASLWQQRKRKSPYRRQPFCRALR